ncbi:MAG: hypothetical protein ISS15_17235 [Alphaproteobacteria bacterium]|nr:hypothetical protein [Alphaproteobacteria bacterium]MBL6937768.1 hypothetical protein [Alphaproteobacteria bacterium]MBL7099406.1 hypothetical protein [Alphaproteobacteria bacterium]
MKFKMLAAAIAAAGLSLLAALPAEAARQNFTLINDTGYTIREVYVSPVSTNSWEEDVMGQDELEDGQSVDITFPHHAGGCYWDLKVVYDDDSDAYWKNFNLCTISEITLNYNRRSGKTWAHWK